MKILSERFSIINEVANEILSAYMSAINIAPWDIPRLIGSVHKVLSDIAEQTVRTPRKEAESKSTKMCKYREFEPEVERSITWSGLISFENGKKYKSLRRHLACCGLTPGDYRNKWNLPPEYLMVAPEYSDRCAERARMLGLGAKTRDAIAIRRERILRSDRTALPREAIAA